jgi:hypothetical protein
MPELTQKKWDQFVTETINLLHDPNDSTYGTGIIRDSLVVLLKDHGCDYRGFCISCYKKNEGSFGPYDNLYPKSFLQNWNTKDDRRYATILFL